MPLAGRASLDKRPPRPILPHGYELLAGRAKINGEARMRRRLVRACLAGALVYCIAIVLSVFWG
jgi:hypothetical protein